MRPQAAASFALHPLRVPGHRIATVQPVLDGATQLLELELQHPQLMLLLHQAQSFAFTIASSWGERFTFIVMAGFQILQIESYLLQPQGGCSIDA